MRDFHIACGQFAAEPGAKSKNIARMIAYASEAKSRAAELILFPELVVTGYLSPGEIISLAEPLTGSSVQSLAKAARDLQIAIAFGIAELDAERDTRYNTLVVLNKQGEMVGVYRKMHLWASEKEWARGGTGVPIFDVDGVRCAGWICYDTRFPEAARMAALAGADVGLVSTAWLGPAAEWELALRARALDNSIFVAGADIISYDPRLRCLGNSMIVGPKGNILAKAEPETECVICALLRAEELVAQRNRVPLLRDRHPGLYGQLVR